MLEATRSSQRSGVRMAADPLVDLKRYDFRLWEKAVMLVSGLGGTALGASGDWLVAAAVWSVGGLALIAGGVRGQRVERRAVEHVRSRAPELTPAQRAVELARIEHFTHGDFGSLSPRVRRLRKELNDLEGGLDTAAVKSHRESLSP